jgi:hypothetical protein
MKKCFVGISTFSPGKVGSENFQKEFWKRGEGFLVLVGNGDMLRRHVEVIRSTNPDATIYVYEWHAETYRSLLEAKRRLYGEDPKIIILNEDVRSHDYVRNPVTNVDLDFHGNFFSYVTLDERGRVSDFTLDSPLRFGVPIISMTFACRGKNADKLEKLGNSLGVPKHEVSMCDAKRFKQEKPDATSRECYNKHYKVLAYRQKDVAIAFLRKYFPQYTFHGPHSYKSGKTSQMFTIIGTLQ